MTDLAKHARIYDAAPDDDTIAKRQSAITDCLKKLRRISQPAELLELVDSVVEAFSSNRPGSILATPTIDAIKASAPAFLEEGNELEVAVIAILSVIELLETNDTAANTNRKDFLAAAVWSAIGFQEPLQNVRLESLRSELLEIARERCRTRAAKTRDRKVVSRSLEELSSGGDPEALRSSLNAAIRAVQALTENSVLDQEEINIAWWAMGGRSPMLKDTYESVPPLSRGVVKAIELGKLLKGVPSQAHRNLALRGVEGSGPSNIDAILAELGDHSTTLGETLPSSELTEKYPLVFPLLASLVSQRASSERSLDGEEWAERALLETTIASLASEHEQRL